VNTKREKTELLRKERSESKEKKKEKERSRKGRKERLKTRESLNKMLDRFRLTNLPRCRLTLPAITSSLIL